MVAVTLSTGPDRGFLADSRFTRGTRLAYGTAPGKETQRKGFLAVRCDIDAVVGASVGFHRRSTYPRVDARYGNAARTTGIDGRGLGDHGYRYRP